MAATWFGPDGYVEFIIPLSFVSSPAAGTPIRLISASTSEYISATMLGAVYVSSVTPRPLVSGPTPVWVGGDVVENVPEWAGTPTAVGVTCP